MVRSFLKFIAPGTPNFQTVIIGKFPNLLIIICVVEINPNTCFQAFISSSGWYFVIFPAISFKMPFKNKFAICGLILGPCFCRNPFLWRIINFIFFLNRFRYFFWMLKFLLFLFLCFSISLLFCVFALLFFLVLCFSVFLLICFSYFSVILIFPGFLFLCYSCFFLFCFPVSFCFLFFLLHYFFISLSFYFYLFFSVIMYFHNISTKNKNI